MAMMVLGLSGVAVLAALIASNVLGFAWFSQSLFGKMWLKGLGRPLKPSKEMKNGMPKAMALNAVGALLTIYVLGYLLNFMGASSWMDGVNTAFWLWLGLVVPVKLGNVLWQMQKWSVFLIESAFQLVNLAVIAAILATL